MNGLPRYDDNPYFNDEFDQLNGIIEIAREEFKPSFILYSLKPETYYFAREDRAQRIYETVFNQFPTPIAICCYRFCNGAENDLQKLYFLRDTWEAIVNLLHALIIAEYRSTRQVIVDASLSLKGVMSDSTITRLRTVSTLLQYANDNKLELSLPLLIPPYTVQKMQLLSGIWDQGIFPGMDVQKILNENLDNFLSILQDLSFLSEVELIRYLGQQGRPDKIQREIFRGHSTNRIVHTKQLEPDQLEKALPLFDNKHVLAVMNDWDLILNLTPFVRFHRKASSYDTKLSCLKKGDRNRCCFQIVGEPEEYIEETQIYQREIEALIPLFGIAESIQAVGASENWISSEILRDQKAIFIDLRNLLATLYPETQDARVVVDDTGLDASKIEFSSRSQTNWHFILDEARKAERLDTLLEVVRAGYSTNPTFMAIYNQLKH